MEVLKANGKLKIVLAIILHRNRIYQVHWYTNMIY